MNAKNEQTSYETTPLKGRPAPSSESMPPLKPFTPGDVSIPDVVNRLEDLVHFALECEGKQMREDISFVEIYKRLQEVRKAIDLLNKDQNDLISLLTKVGGEEFNPNTVDLSVEDKKLLEKLNHLRSVCEAAKERIHAQTREHPEAEQVAKEKIEEAISAPKKKVARRKGKFRAMGGDRWMRT